MTVPSERHDPGEANWWVTDTIRIDLRAAASGPDAMDAASIDGSTLESLQRRAPASSGQNGHAAGWRLVNTERLLIVDDTDAFPQHAAALRHLFEAPTCERTLCVLVGPAAADRDVDVPGLVEFHRVPILWVADPCGVGWRMGRSKPSALAFNDADPDGAGTVRDLLDVLLSPQVFDEMTKALRGLPHRFGLPALLPCAYWPDTGSAADPPAAEPGPPEAVTAAPEPPVTEPASVAAGAAPSALGGPPPPPPPPARRNLVVRFIQRLLALLRIRRPAAPVPAPTPPLTLPWPAAPPGPASEQASSRPPASPSPPVPPGALTHARWIMSAGPDNDSFRQLCTARQVILLNGESRLARLIRFAPAATRDFFEGPAGDGVRVAWTSGDIVGAIRLVPLKEGLVRLR